jgi:hypothetical protein
MNGEERTIQTYEVEIVEEYSSAQLRIILVRQVIRRFSDAAHVQTEHKVCDSVLFVMGSCRLLLLTSRVM